MSTALRLIFGLSILAIASGCDNAGSGDDMGDGPNAVNAGTNSGPTAGTSTGTGGSGVIPSGGTDSGGNTAMLPEGVPLTPVDGWVDGASNTLGIQGAMFSY